VDEIRDRPLGVTVRVGDQVGPRGLALEPAYRAADALEQQVAGRAGGALGQLQVVAQNARTNSTTPTTTAPIAAT